MYKESVCAVTESKKVNAMVGKQVGHKIHKCMLWENKTGEHGKKAAKCYLWSKSTYSPPWEGDTTTNNSVYTLQVFKCTYVVLQKLCLGKFNDIIFQFRTTETINENEGN